MALYYVKLELHKPVFKTVNAIIRANGLGLHDVGTMKHPKSFNAWQLSFFTPENKRIKYSDIGGR
jgi:hypothetical protein